MEFYVVTCTEKDGNVAFVLDMDFDDDCVWAFSNLEQAEKVLKYRLLFKWKNGEEHAICKADTSQLEIGGDFDFNGQGIDNLRTHYNKLILALKHQLN